MNTLLYLFSLPYMRVQLLFIIIPSILLWVFAGTYLLRYKKTLLTIMILSLIWGFIYDEIASPVAGLWHFTSAPTMGIWFFGLPFEEWLFLFIVPQEITSIFLLFRKKLYG